MYSHFTLTWGNSELPKCWNETPSRGVSLSIRMTDFLSARTVWLPCCLSGKKYLAGMRYPWSVEFYGLCNAPSGLLRETQTPDLTWSGAIKVAEVQDGPLTPKFCWVRIDRLAAQNTRYLFKFPQFKNWTTGKQTVPALWEITKEWDDSTVFM